MILYHGSNIEIENINLECGRRGKDFGQGFYLCADRQQAMKMAERTVAREEVGVPTITAYSFDENNLITPSALNVKIFEKCSAEWAEFILLNRQNRTRQQAHTFDIVYGPIADDKIGLQLSRYQLRYIAMDELVRQLTFIHPTFQYFFGTEIAISLLEKVKENE